MGTGKTGSTIPERVLGSLLLLLLPRPPLRVVGGPWVVHLASVSTLVLVHDLALVLLALG